MFRLRDYSLRQQQRLQPELRQQVPTKTSYIVDLPRLMGVCEANFLRLKKLTQDMTSSDVRFSVERGSLAYTHQLQLIERAKYTSTWIFESLSVSPSPWLKLPVITFRAYHDAQLVEVIGWEGHKRFKPRYEQPNPQAYARDEKFQNNRFLGEWLQDCLVRGMSLPQTAEWLSSAKIQD
ncbi:MAG: DUF1249 domain-containing protein [Cellvibrio sp.]